MNIFNELNDLFFLLCIVEINFHDILVNIAEIFELGQWLNLSVEVHQPTDYPYVI